MKRILKLFVLPMIVFTITLNTSCQCSKDENHHHIVETNICEECHQECDCMLNLPRDICGPGDCW